MNEENPYESPQTIDDLKEKQPTEKLPKLAKVRAVLMFVCLGLVTVGLLITLCDSFFINETNRKPPIDSYVSLNYGLPFIKIGSFFGAAGMASITLSFIIQGIRKKFFDK